MELCNPPLPLSIDEITFRRERDTVNRVFDSSFRASIELKLIVFVNEWLVCSLAKGNNLDAFKEA